MLLGQTTFFISDASDAKSLQQFAATLQTAEVAKVAALPGREVDAQTHSSHIGLKDFDNKQHELAPKMKMEDATRRLLQRQQHYQQELQELQEGRRAH